jgi:hypothetical protein
MECLCMRFASTLNYLHRVLCLLIELSLYVYIEPMSFSGRLLTLNRSVIGIALIFAFQITGSDKQSYSFKQENIRNSYSP